MVILASDTAQGAWQLAQALHRCEQAAVELDRAGADLRAAGQDCAWRVRAADPLRAAIDEQVQALQGAREQVGALERTLQAG